MPLTSKGQEILENMEKFYGSKEKAQRVLYASKNAGKISGIDAKDDSFQSAGALRLRFGNVRIERSGDKFVVQGKTYDTYEEAKRAANAARSDDDAPAELRDRCVDAALHAFEDAAFRLDSAKR